MKRKKKKKKNEGQNRAIRVEAPRGKSDGPRITRIYVGLEQSERARIPFGSIAILTGLFDSCILHGLLSSDGPGARKIGRV